MRVVFDTNVVISGMLWSGTPHTALRLATTERVDAISSELLLDELRGVLQRGKFEKYLQRIDKSVEQLIDEYLEYTQIIEPASVPKDAVRDIKDTIVLETAIGGNATYIVSGDDDLLTLGAYVNISCLFRHF
jgi:hypothetical protein